MISTDNVRSDVQRVGIDFALHDAAANAETDIEAARRVQAARCSCASPAAWPPRAAG